MFQVAVPRTNETMTDIFDKCTSYTAARDVIEAGLYPYFQPLQENYGPEAIVKGRRAPKIRD